MTRDIRLLDLSMGEKKIFVADGVKPAMDKLQRSVASNKALPSGYAIKSEDLQLLSPGDGFSWSDRDKVVGRVVQTDIPANEVIYAHMLAD